MGDRRDQVALLLVEAPLGREVAEGIDGATPAMHGGEREPEIHAPTVTGNVVERADLPCSATGIRSASASHSAKVSAAVVGHHIGQQLVEAVVHPILVERLSECAGSIE